MTIRAAFIFDDYSFSTTEVQDAILELNAIAQLPPDSELDIKIAFSGNVFSSDARKNQYDLVIIDYGGVGTWNTASGNAQIWSVCQYAEDHPSSLVVIWTGFTADIYRDQIEPQFEGVDNIVCRYGDSVYENLDGSPEFLSKFRAWFANEIEKGIPMMTRVEFVETVEAVG